MSNMTRKEAIDWLCRLHSNVSTFMSKIWREEFMEALDFAIVSLKTDEALAVNMHYPPDSESAYEKALLKAYADGQASVDPKWIPVSERLPEESYNSILGWDAYRERCVLVQYVDGRFQIAGKTESFDIRAWMPLPKPYEPQESEDKENTDVRDNFK